MSRIKLGAAAVVAAAAIAGGFGTAQLATGSDTATCAPIGFQNGVAAATERMKRLDPAGFNASGTGAWDKFFRSVKRLVDDHDAACATPQPPPTTTAPPPTTTAPAPRPAPQTYNRGSSGQDARYCVDDLPTVDGVKVDAAGFRYDDGGRSLGGRTGNPIDVLKPADAMDGKGPCDPYTKDGRSFPPWPPASYLP